MTMPWAQLRWLPGSVTFGWLFAGLVAIPFGGLPEALALSNQWLYHGTSLACAAMCLTVGNGKKRPIGWTLLILGCLDWLCGSLYFIQLPMDVAASLGWDDLGYALFYLFAGAGILVIRLGPRPTAASTWSRRAQAIRLIDGIAVALAINAIGAAFTFDQVGDSLRRDPYGTLMNLAYPVFASVLLGLLVVILAMREWRGHALWWWISAGILAFWVSDTAFSSSAAQGVYLLGAALDVGWVGAFACFGCAAAACHGTARNRRPASSDWRTVAVPCLFSLLAFVVLLLTVFHGLNLVASALAAAAMFAVVIRQAVTLIDHHLLIASVRQEARTDALTGLANRRALFDDLRERCDSETGRPFVLALFDLDGFKSLNDVFGHAAGDALLTRRGRALQAVPGIDRAYRLGGDEYCVIVPTDSDPDWRPVVQACVAALVEEGPGYRISSSCGHALAPQEAESIGDVMDLADRRMYADKAERRSRGEGDSLKSGHRVARSGRQAVDESSAERWFA